VELAVIEARPMEPHPWNTSFEWTLPATAPRRLTPEEKAAFDADGFVVARGVLDDDLRAELVDQLDRYEASVDEFLATQDDGRFGIAETGAISFAPHAVLRSAAARAAATLPAILDLCADLIGPDVRLYWDQAVYKKPEKPRRFPWHQDNGYTYIEPQQYLTCWVALTEASVAHGCPWLVPGVHRQGTLRHRYVEPLGFECFAEPPADARPAELGPGDAAVFSSLTPHLTGPNTTGEVRKAYILQYAPEGAATLVGDPDAGPPTGRTPCTAEGRQFAVLRGGAPVPGPAPT
jgi:ectoine hydroxylase-related dioxygenase (phytanoyl-CoA dioxygenase family)